MRLTFSTSGAEPTEHMLLGIATRAEDARPVLGSIADALRAHEAMLFETEGMGQWAPLAETTVEKKAAAGLDPHILQATKAMRNALAEQGAEHLEHVTADELIFGATGDAATKAARHKTGTSRMPARDPVMLDETAKRGISKAVQRFIVETERATLGAAPFGVATLDPFGLQ